MFFQLTLFNPFYRKSKYKCLYSFNKKVSTFKHLEFEVIKDNYYLFNVNFEWRRNKDHAGIQARINLFCYEISLMYYDIRHWDYASNCWNDMHKQNLDGF